jgi:acyl-CoA dehydrogenase
MNGLYRFQEALRGVVDNFPVPAARWAMRVIAFPLGNPYRPAPDALGHRAVKLLLNAPEVRDRLTRYIYVSNAVDDPMGLLEVTLKKAIAAEEAEKKLDRAIRAGTLRRYHGVDWIGEAIEKGIVTESEGQQLRELEALTARVIAVDHFDPAALKPNYRANTGANGPNSRGVETAAAE